MKEEKGLIGAMVFNKNVFFFRRFSVYLYSEAILSNALGKITFNHLAFLYHLGGNVIHILKAAPSFPFAKDAGIMPPWY